MARKINFFFLATLMVVCACVQRTPTPDSLHHPALQLTPTAEARSLTTGNGIRCDVNNDGRCDATDVAVVQNDIRATRRAPTATKAATATAKPTAAATVTRAATATAAPTATSAPSATPTTAPSATAAPTAQPTATTIPPTEADCLNCVKPADIQPMPSPIPDLHGKPCAPWVHDLYLVSVPHGNTLRYYRTWHPQVVPEGQPGAGCYFDHSHGTRDPRGSHADPTLPAYGLEADAMGMVEPHAGFKTEYANAGECNELEDFCATSDTKLTVHMGTAGAGRLSVEFHTFVFDLIGDKGSVVHVRGMASTGQAGTQCIEPPSEVGKGFRLIAMPKDDAAKCGVTIPYEVWLFSFAAGGNSIISKFATFDGITVGRRQADGSLKLESTALTWPNAPFSGCKADVYFGGMELRENVDFVDAHGFRQYVHIGSDGGKLVLDTSQWHKNTFKAPFDACDFKPDNVTYTTN